MALFKSIAGIARQFLSGLAWLVTFAVVTLPAQQTGSLRVATFNVSLNRPEAGQLVADLERGDEQASRVAEIIQRIRPDVLLLNEFDQDAEGVAARLFLERYLGRGQRRQQAIEFEYVFHAPVNTGEPSGHDLDRDGRADGPADAYGYGKFPGQYGMLVLSRFPLKGREVRTFRKFLWKDMPRALQPRDPTTGMPFYAASVWNRFRLSSKSHWDIPLRIGGATLHFLVLHPTPPSFDGPEDRNGSRNHDEIRLIADYLLPGRATYIVDDQGVAGGLPDDAKFVIAGDLNADPVDGGSRKGAIQQLLEHSLVAKDFGPDSEGAVEQAAKQGGANAQHRGNSRNDTADFSDRSVGNLRVDYVLPSRNLRVTDAGVFWPRSNEAGAELLQASDHRLVWIDIQL